MRRDGTRTGVPAVVMRWDASDVVPGVVTNKSLNLSTTVTKHVLIISGNSTLGGDPNFGNAHSSVISWFASSIVSPILATGHFFVLKRRSAVYIGFIGGADSWFALSFEGATVTGVVVKSNTSPCNCRKSVPMQYYSGDQVFHYNKIVEFLGCSESHCRFYVL